VSRTSAHRKRAPARLPHTAGMKRSLREGVALLSDVEPVP
jgi:hypothetical protein